MAEMTDAEKLPLLQQIAQNTKNFGGSTTTSWIGPNGEIAYKYDPVSMQGWHSVTPYQHAR